MSNKLKLSLLTSLLLITACQQEREPQQQEQREFDHERLDRIEAGGRRSHEDMLDRIEEWKNPSKQPPSDSSNSSEPHRWIVNAFFSGCPEVSDWFRMQHLVQDGNFDNDHLAVLPDRCIMFEPGAYLIAPLKEHRETYMNNGHEYESFSLEDGTKLWGDGMDEVTTSDLGVLKK